MSLRWYLVKKKYRTLWHPSSKSWSSQSHNQTDGRRTDECGGFSCDSLCSGSNRKLVCLLDLPHVGHQARTAEKITETSLSHSQDITPRTSACPPTPHLASFNPVQVRVCQVALSRSDFKLALEFNNCLALIKCQTFCCYHRTSFCPT